MLAMVPQTISADKSLRQQQLVRRRDGFGTMPPWSNRGRSRAQSIQSRAAISTPTRSRFSIDSGSSITWPTSLAEACAICCSAAVPRILTSARRPIPYQVKKLFRNCWIIGRRFRLAHVKFGSKVIEVATFRRQVQAGEEIVAGGRSGSRPVDVCGPAADPPRQHLRHARRGRVPARLHDQRARLRYRDLLDHRLRQRHGGSAGRHRALDRRSGSAVRRGSGTDAACGRARGAPRLHAGSAGARSDSAASPRDRAQFTATPPRGVLQDPALGLRGEDVSGPCPRGVAGTDFRRAPSGSRRAALAIACGRGRLPPQVRVDARHVHEHAAPRQPARSAWLSPDIGPPLIGVLRRRGGDGTTTGRPPAGPARRRAFEAGPRAAAADSRS